MTELIEVYCDLLEEAECSVATIDLRRTILTRADRELPHGLVKACGNELSEYLRRYEKKWTKWTYYTAFRCFYNEMVGIGELAFAPTDYVKRPKVGVPLPNPLSDEQVNTAVCLAPGCPWLAAVILGAYAGLRCAEMCDLKRADVTEENVHVENGKGGKPRDIPTHPMVWNLVRGMPDGLIVRSVSGRRGGGLKPNSLSGAQREFWRSIGFSDDVHLHRLRHWFGTTLVNEGARIEVVSQLLGHTSIMTTMGYVLVANDRKKAAVARLPMQGLQPGRSRLESADKLAA